MAKLREFTGTDFYAWGGANDFSDESKPMIAEGEFGTIIVCGSETEDGSATISIYFGEDEDNDEWAFKSFESKEDAIKDARFLVNLLGEEIDVLQLVRFGFTIVC